MASTIASMSGVLAPTDSVPDGSVVVVGYPVGAQRSKDDLMSAAEAFGDPTWVPRWWWNNSEAVIISIDDDFTAAELYAAFRDSNGNYPAIQRLDSDADQEKLARNFELYVPWGTMVPAGTMLVITWPTGTVVPSQDALASHAAKLGRPFEIGIPKSHIGLELAAEARSEALYEHFKYGGSYPIIARADATAQDALEFLEKYSEIKDSLKELGSGGLGLADFMINLPKYLLIAGLVAGGAIIVGGGVYLAVKYFSEREEKEKKK